MELTFENESCSFKNEVIPHGSEVGGKGKSFICINGKWVEKDELEKQGC